LVFKGGTSLSKAYGVIRRFSEDVDLTYDIRAIASDLVGDGDAIDYHAAVAGGLQLVPDDTALAKLAADYQSMVDDGLFLDDVEPFATLIDRCLSIQKKANGIITLE